MFPTMLEQLVNIALMRTPKSRIDAEIANMKIGHAEAAAMANGNLANLFFAHDGRVIHKWVHYLDIYDRHFAHLRNKPVRLLEIGVSKGGSLELWRKYFGRSATIFGIDIDPACASRVSPPNQVRIGSQDDPAFLAGVISEMGPPDIIIDDGSHVGRHQCAAFHTLFPALNDHGLYVIEDVHTAYWPRYQGRYLRRLLRGMIDDLHGWYHDRRSSTPAKEQISAIHVYDSVLVIEKRRKGRPGHIKVGC